MRIEFETEEWVVLVLAVVVVAFFSIVITSPGCQNTIDHSKVEATK